MRRKIVFDLKNHFESNFQTCFQVDWPVFFQNKKINNHFSCYCRFWPRLLPHRHHPTTNDDDLWNWSSLQILCWLRNSDPQIWGHGITFQGKILTIQIFIGFFDFERYFWHFLFRELEPTSSEVSPALVSFLDLILSRTSTSRCAPDKDFL